MLVRREWVLLALLFTAPVTTPALKFPERRVVAPGSYVARWLRNVVLASVATAGLISLLLFRSRHPTLNQLRYVQLTHFTDSAVAPALSPDGRMVTFIRGGEFFFGRARRHEGQGDLLTSARRSLREAVTRTENFFEDFG